MKKIKKLLTIGLAVLLMLCMSISLFGCNYEYVWDFYDYGTTKIPEEIDKSTPEESSLPLTCINEIIPY